VARGIARQPKARALHGVVEELQPALAARLARDPDRRLANAKPVEEQRGGEDDDCDEQGFPHARRGKAPRPAR
jgi:hypothetical protein